MTAHDKEQTSPGLIKRFEKQFLISIAFGMLVFLLLTIYAQAGELKKAFISFNTWYIPLILVLAFGNYVMRFLRWEFYLNTLNIDLHIANSFIVFMSGLSMSVTPGKFGELLKSYLLKKLRETPVSVSAPVVFAERFTDFTALLILSFTGVLIFHYGLTILIVSTLIVFLLLFILGNERLAFACISLASGIPVIRGFSSKLRDLYTNTRALVGFRELLIGTFIGILSWSCECVAFYVVFMGFGLTFPVFQAFFIYSFATIAGAISMLPGGVGATEGSITFLLVSAGIPRATGVAATFIIRVCTLWFALVVGLLFLFYFRDRFEGIEQILDEELTTESGDPG